mmetsp:Transcript_23006/g.59894  ORF Transcript_23006/g.59894 Transcript_23006/m.59894 type:complete len:206 (-) Transcript_23006:13-630(-)
MSAVELAAVGVGAEVLGVVVGVLGCWRREARRRARPNGSPTTGRQWVCSVRVEVLLRNPRLVHLGRGGRRLISRPRCCLVVSRLGPGGRLRRLALLQPRPLVPLHLLPQLRVSLLQLHHLPPQALHRQLLPRLAGARVLLLLLQRRLQRLDLCALLLVGHVEQRLALLLQHALLALVHPRRRLPLLLQCLQVRRLLPLERHALAL